MPHQGLQDIRERRIQPPPLLLEHTVVVNVIVHHESEAAGAPERIYRVRHTVKVGEVVEHHIHRTPEVDGGIEEQVGQEDDVGRVPDYSHGETGVGADDVVVDRFRDVLCVPGDKDGRLEGGIVGVVEGFEAGDGGCVVIGVDVGVVCSRFDRLGREL